MRRKRIFIVLMLVAFLLSSIKGYCQKQAQMSVIWINEVPLSAQEKYEAVIKKQVQLLTNSTLTHLLICLFCNID